MYTYTYIYIYINIYIYIYIYIYTFVVSTPQLLLSESPHYLAVFSVEIDD